MVPRGLCSGTRVLSPVRRLVESEHDERDGRHPRHGLVLQAEEVGAERFRGAGGGRPHLAPRQPVRKGARSLRVRVSTNAKRMMMVS